ncbi:hypothetical protein D3C81_1700630 [compost metagenome]
MSGCCCCIARAYAQCVVARRPSSSPASASTKAPVHIDAARRARGAARRTKSRCAAGVGVATGSPTPTMIHVSTAVRGPAARVSTCMPSEEATGPPSTE